MELSTRHSGRYWFSRTTRAGTLLLLLFLSFCSSLTALAQNRSLTGRIVSAAGDGLSGASVRIKGGSGGVNTDNNGAFTLTIPQNAILVVSYVGYSSQELAVRPEQNDVVITLEPSGAQLNEVVVIGYGTANKRDLTGSITKIAGSEVADKPNPNPVASLQGRVAGLSVVNSGTPGQEPDIRIRGTVSIGAVKPLYVVDGIFNDNIDFLNPNDIESIEVLKDPSSLAIFGVRGASGVIAVTTKKAKAGQTLVNFNSTFGARRLVDRIKMVDAAGFRELFQEEEGNIGIPQNERFDFSKWNGNTDWVDAMTRTGMFTSNNLSFTGASDRNRFYMGVGYIGEQGVVKREQLDKITLSLSNEYRASKNLRIGFNMNGIRQKLPFSQANGLLFDARRVLPITPVMDPTGSYYTELAIQSAQLSNPLMNLESKWDKERRIENRIVGSIFAEISFLRNFTFRSTLYGDMSQLSTQRYNPIIYTFNPVQDTVYVDRNNRLTSVVNNRENWNKYQQDHILTYKKDFGKHAITATGGFTTYYNEYRGLYASVAQKSTGDPIPDDDRFWFINNGYGDQSSQRSSSNQWERATVSGLVRALYNFENKYYVNASFRRDGSSQISPENRWQNFYSVGAAWEVSRENFMANIRQINFLKLKGSWGVLGVQNTAGFDYPFYPTLLTGNTAVFGSNIVPSYTLAYSPDRNLRWEKVSSYEFGFEANAFDNRLYVEAAYYNKRTKDLMISERTGGSVGNRLGNIGEIVNHGLELTSSWTQRFGRDFTLTFGGNFTTFNNKVAVLPEGSIQYPSEERPNKTEQGFPIGYFYGYVVEGVYQSYADKLKSPKVVGYEYGPGDLKYKDINGDGIIDANDRTMIGNPTPDFAYGFNISANWKGFDLGIDFNGVYGNEIYRFWGSSELPFTTFNYPAFKMDRWRGEGTSNWDPILGANHVINRLPSTYGIEDGSYLRIRNLQVGYNIPTNSLGRLRMKNFRIFANIQNLKTWKNNSGYTPEFGGSPTSFGIDNGNGPLPAVYTGGINVTF